MPQPKRVLVVDDEQRNRNLMQAMLQSFGYDTEEVSSGAEALKRINGTFDLVLLDVMMPDMDGFEIARLIRENPDSTDIPIIMVTILSDREDRLRAVEAGANDFVTKPVDKTELRVRVASLLKIKEAQDQIKRHRAELEAAVEKRTQSLLDLLETSTNIVQSIPSGLIVCQYQAPGELFLVNCNPEAKRLTGLEVDQWRGQELDEMWPNSRRQGFYQAFLRTMETGEIFKTEEAFYEKGDIARYFRLRAFPMPGDLLGIAFEDVTESRRTKEPTEETERNDEIPSRKQPTLQASSLTEPKNQNTAVEFVMDEAPSPRINAIAGVASEAALGLVQLFESIGTNSNEALAMIESGDPVEIRSLLEDIRDTASRGTQTANNLREFVRARVDMGFSDGKEIFDLSEAVRKAIRKTDPWLNARKIKTGVTVSLDVDLTVGCLIRGEERQIIEIVANLFRNSVEASPKGGTITIHTKMKGNQAVLHVMDNGVGIPETDFAKIFHPFWTTKDSHTGLGLTVSLAIAHRHRGTISVKCSPHGQTSFTVGFQSVKASE
jgi:CheY-like chemotaxis protein/anti-sigma regulatory factor (Ser/Thr protein kinase)